MTLLKSQNTHHNIIIVPSTDLLISDISAATEFYEKELKWDTISNHRNVCFHFELEKELNLDIQYNSLKFNWYKALIEELPAYLYYLEQGQFQEILQVMLYGLDIKGIKQELENGQLFNTRNPMQLNTHMKTYILESIEDLHKYNDAPIELLSNVYSEIVTMK